MSGGRIYVIGGRSAANAALSSVEVYNPATNRWSAGPSLPVARSGLAAAAGPDGRIFVIGGRVAPFGNPATAVLALNPASGTWSEVAPLPTPREYLAAALGSDGKIYAIGGALGGVLGTVVAYNPATNTWSALAPLPTPRAVLAAATAADGRTYAIGGTNGVHDLATVEAYTPASNTWSPAAQLPVGRQGLGAAGLFGRLFVAGGSADALADGYSAATNDWTSLPVLSVPRRQGATVAGPDGRLYVIGGIGLTDAVLATAEAFRPAEPTPARIDIQPGDPLHQVDLGSTGYVRVALLESRDFDLDDVDGASLRFAGAAPIQLRGGAHPGKRAFDELVPKSRHHERRERRDDGRDVRIFRFPISALKLPIGATRACLAGQFERRGEFEGCGPVRTGGTPRAWSAIAPMLDVRFQGAMVADATGRVYAIAGWDGVASETATVERYDAVLNQWSHVAPMTAARTGLGAALGPDGRIYVAGGFDGADAVASGQAYDPATDSWSPLPLMGHVRDETGAAFGTDGRFYVFGGHDEVTPTGTVDVFNPATGAWSAGVAMPAARFDHTVVRAPSGEIYVMGGWDSFTATGPQTTVWAYNPATSSWRTLASLPAPRSGAAAAVDSRGLVYLVGGDDGTATVNTVFAYDPATNSWTEVAGMASAREGHGAATAGDGRIIAAGGFDGVDFIRAAEALAKP